MNNYIKIICVSDTHLSTPKLPPGDILIHAGDLTWTGGAEQCNKAMAWLSKQSYNQIVFCAGNHDFNFWDKKESMEIPKNLTYLQDGSANIMGLNFFGFPWTPKFFDWAFMYEKKEAVKYCDKILPCDILISHGPPSHILDISGGDHVGCPALWNKVKEIKPILHVFGHIHEQSGVFTDTDGIVYVNAAIKPRVVVIENKKVIDVY